MDELPAIVDMIDAEGTDGLVRINSRGSVLSAASGTGGRGSDPDPFGEWDARMVSSDGDGMGGGGLPVGPAGLSMAGIRDEEERAEAGWRGVKFLNMIQGSEGPEGSASTWEDLVNEETKFNKGVRRGGLGSNGDSMKFRSTITGGVSVASRRAALNAVGPCIDIRDIHHPTDPAIRFAWPLRMRLLRLEQVGGPDLEIFERVQGDKEKAHSYHIIGLNLVASIYVNATMIPNSTMDFGTEAYAHHDPAFR